MAKDYATFSLINASEARQFHDDNISLPRVKSIKNMYLSRSDKVPTLRNDLTPETTELLGWSDGDIGSNDDYLNSIYDARSGAYVLYISRLIPYTSDGSVTTRVSIYDEGTMGNGGVSGTTITGSGTEWAQNAAAGYWLVWTDGSEYKARIISVTDDTHLVIDTAAAIANATSYEIYQTHNSELADYPMNVQFWGDAIIYQATDPSVVIDRDTCTGPFQNVVQEPVYDFNDNVVGVGSKYPQYRRQMLRMGSNYVYGQKYTSDPSGSWSSATTLTGNDNLTSYDFSTSGVAVYDGKFYTSADSGASWTNQHDIDNEFGNGTYAVAFDGTNAVVGAAGGYIYYADSGDWTDWTEVSVAAAQANDAAFDGVNFIVAFGSAIWQSDGSDTDTWASTFNPAGSPIYQLVTNQAGTVVGRAGNGKIIVGHGEGFRLVNDLAGVNGTSLTWDTFFFIVTTDSGKIWYSEDGDDWDYIEFPETGHTAALFSASTRANLLTFKDATNDACWHAASTSTEIIFNDFEPISKDYRGACFTIAGGYVLLGSVAEWNDDASKWTHYPRRIRYTSPGSVADFEGEGASFIDCDGSGAIIDIRSVKQNVIVFGSDDVGLLTQSIGNLDNPWGYFPLKKGCRLISNPIVVDNVCWFIADDGKLWTTNGVSVQAAGEYDLTQYDDFDTTGPIWLSHDRTHGCFVVFRPSTGSTHSCDMISVDSGAVSHFTLPQFTTGGTTYKPKGVSVKEVANATYLYVHYGVVAAASDETQSAYFNTGAAIKGIDVPYTGLTNRWWAMIQGGADKVVKEFYRAMISEFEVNTYCDGTVGPDVTVELLDELGETWLHNGDSHGTIALTGGNTCTGTGTAWSHTLGSDSGTTFTTPCIPTQGVYFKVVGGVYTQLTLTTDYTLSSTQITLVTGLVAGQSLYVRWNAHPLVKVAAGDYIRSTGDNLFHLITAITTPTAMTLESYPETDPDVGTHYPALQMVEGEDSELILAIAQSCEELTWRIYVIPRNDSSASTIAKIYQFAVRYTTKGPEIRK